MNENQVFGTKEWSVASINCVNGCEHDCRYCYARYNAVVRFHRIAKDEWPVMRVRPHDVHKRRPRYDGTVMFPTTHDITPSVLDSCLVVMKNLVMAGNRVLVVSKPHLDCVSSICDTFLDARGQLLFRFTIGADDDALLQYWEPGAPGFEERLLALEYAFEAGFETSVSVEPMLDAANIHRLVERLDPLVTDAIWIGKMNGISSRVLVSTETDRAQVQGVVDGQRDDRIMALYERCKDNPKVKWKESIKKVVGVPVSTKAGEDR